MMDEKRFSEIVKNWGALPDFGGLEFLKDAVEWAEDQDPQWWNRPAGHFRPDIGDIVHSYMLVVAICEVWQIPDALAILESGAPLKTNSPIKKEQWAKALRGYLGISAVHLEPTNQKMLDHLKVCKSCQEDLNNSVVITSENQTASDVINQLHRKRRENGIPGVINAIAIENDLIISEEVPVPELNTLKNAAQAFAELVKLRGESEEPKEAFIDGIDWGPHGIPTENEWNSMNNQQRVGAVKVACNAMFKALKEDPIFDIKYMPTQEQWDQLTTKEKFNVAMEELVGAIGQETILQESPSDAIN